MPGFIIFAGRQPTDVPVLIRRFENALTKSPAIGKVGDFNYNAGVIRGVAQLGSALRSGRRGHRFNSGHPDS